MLVVREIIEFLPDGSKTDFKSLPFRPRGKFDCEVYVRLEETRTGQCTEFRCHTGVALAEWLSQVKPYGFANRVDEKVADNNELIVIDDISLKFLEYVDTVLVSGLDEFQSRPLNLEFEPIDDDMSLFICISDGRERVCTLLQAVCYAPGSIVGDKAVFYGTEWFSDFDVELMSDEEYDNYDPNRKFTVVFSDFQSAMRLINKYRTVGHNPLDTAFGECDEG